MGEELKIELFRPEARGAIWSILYYILLVDRSLSIEATPSSIEY
jgi:hypothetical protein